MAELSRALAQQAVDAMEKHAGNKAQAAASLGLTRETYRGRLTAAARYGLAPGKGVVSADDPAHLKHQLKKLAAELVAAKSKALDEESIRRKIINLSQAVDQTQAPEWTVEPRADHSDPGVPTLFMSDWHFGEVVAPSQIGGVNRYNLAIARERVRMLVEASIELLRIISPQMRYPGIVAPLGGDMVSGNIHDELTATNELNTMPTVLELFGVLIWVIETLAATFGRVFLPCVGGNHGRDTHKIWTKDRHHTSFDWLLYCFLAKRFENDPRVTFLIPDGPDAYFRIYGHRYLLTHGDQFRGGDGMIGALGPIIRGDHKKRSRNAQIDMQYDTLMMGHWHQDIFLRRLIVNGSLKGYDEYAYSNNFGFEPPTQQLWITHPKHRITFRMPVHVDRLQSEPKTSWVSVPERKAA